MSLTIERLEFFFVILVRISAFIVTAPFFNQRTVPVRVKAGLSVFLSMLVFNTIKYVPLTYSTTVGYVLLIVKETAIGLSLGYMANMCLYILDLAGRMIDTEIGFSMVNVLNPVSNIQTSVTGTLYTYLVMLVMLVSDMHYFLISALVDTFQLIPIEGGVIPANVYVIVLKFVKDYFIIAFRIILPVFASILIVNIVLGILAKIAPQMNMFVIGMQLKVFVGLIILFLIVGMLPSITDFIFNEMKDVLHDMIKAFTPT